MDATGTDKPDGKIPTNLRMLLILEEIAKAGVPLTPTDLNQTIGLPKPTIHRLFATLEAEGFVQRELDGRSFTPGRRLRRFSANVLSSLRVRTARLSVLGALASDIGETCNIAIPDREAMTYLDRVETKWPLRIQLPIGSQVPFHCTASGKLHLSNMRQSTLDAFLSSAKLEARTEKTLVEPALLKAELKRTSERGFAIDEEEFMTGMIAIAVPVLDQQSRMMATLSIHAPLMRCSVNDLFGYLPVLREGASSLADLQNK